MNKSVMNTAYDSTTNRDNMFADYFRIGLMKRSRFKDLKKGAVFFKFNQSDDPERKKILSEFAAVKISDSTFKCIPSHNTYDIDHPRWGLDTNFRVRQVGPKKAKRLLKLQEMNVKGTRKAMRRRKQKAAEQEVFKYKKKSSQRTPRDISPEVSERKEKILKLFDEGKDNKVIIKAVGCKGQVIRAILRKERKEEYAKRKNGGK